MNYSFHYINPNQVFVYYNLVYDVACGLTIANSRNAPVINLEKDYANDLYQQHKHLININNFHWPNTNCNEPLLFAINPNTGAHFLIDGWHRLKKAVYNNFTLRARYLTYDESMSIIKDTSLPPFT